MASGGWCQNYLQENQLVMQRITWWCEENPRHLVTRRVRSEMFCVIMKETHRRQGLQAL